MTSTNVSGRAPQECPHHEDGGGQQDRHPAPVMLGQRAGDEGPGMRPASPSS